MEEFTRDPGKKIYKTAKEDSPQRQGFVFQAFGKKENASVNDFNAD